MTAPLADSVGAKADTGPPWPETAGRCLDGAKREAKLVCDSPAPAVRCGVADAVLVFAGATGARATAERSLCDERLAV
jgi:hypothetical protein